VQGLKPGVPCGFDVAAEQAAEKVRSEPGLVAQPLLAVWILQHLTKAYSQEWLCYTIFSAACEAAIHKIYCELA
jgi:hypothetical protein